MNNDTIDAANEAIRKGDALTRLEANPDFKEIIIKGFIESGSTTLIDLMAHRMDEDSVNEITRKLQGISFLKDYFAQISGYGKSAQDYLTKLDCSDAEIIE